MWFLGGFVKINREEGAPLELTTYHRIELSKERNLFFARLTYCRRSIRSSAAPPPDAGGDV
eukprot:11222352-Lingulodinium_polyedra.AAC.1